MKRPWLSVVVFCAVFSSIIIFCVIFGGFSSLYRAQNRIKDAKRLMAVECQKQLDLLPELIAMAKKTALPEPILDKLARIDGAAQGAKEILTRIDSASPLEKELVAAFEESQVRLEQEIRGMIRELKNDETLKKSAVFIALEKKFEALETALFVTSHQYNREARFFNTRKEEFPILYIAKLFKLDQIYFPEITASLFTPENVKS